MCICLWNKQPSDSNLCHHLNLSEFFLQSASLFKLIIKSLRLFITRAILIFIDDMCVSTIRPRETDFFLSLRSLFMHKVKGVQKCGALLSAFDTIRKFLRGLSWFRGGAGWSALGRGPLGCVCVGGRLSFFTLNQLCCWDLCTDMNVDFKEDIFWGIGC